MMIIYKAVCLTFRKSSFAFLEERKLRIGDHVIYGTRKLQIG